MITRGKEIWGWGDGIGEGKGEINGDGKKLGVVTHNTKYMYYVL